MIKSSRTKKNQWNIYIHTHTHTHTMGTKLHTMGTKFERENK